MLDLIFHMDPNFDFDQLLSDCMTELVSDCEQPVRVLEAFQTLDVNVIKHIDDYMWY